MQMFFPGDLTALNAVQNVSPFAGPEGATGEEQAFQLLLESMLFQTVTKELFQGKGGLLAGMGLGLFQEEDQDNKAQSDNILSLLELLQLPLMEQLRPIQGEVGSSEAQMTTLSSPLEAQNDPELLTVPLEGWQQLQHSLSVDEEKGNTPEPSSQNLAYANNKEETLTPSAAQNVQGEQQADFKVDNLAAKTGEGRRENLFQGFTGQTTEATKSGEGATTASLIQDLPEKISYRSISEQIIQSGKLKLLGQKQEIEIQLKPEHLGRLALKVTAENGILTARFLVENYQVSRALDQNLTNIRQTLADQGISLDQVQVEVGDPRSSFQEQQRAWGEGRENGDSQPERPKAGGVLEELLNPQELLTKIGIDYRA
ncbi:MAG: flagellar hook-length control protein FliK [Bacillota bacterium]